VYFYVLSKAGMQKMIIFLLIMKEAAFNGAASLGINFS